MDSIVITPKTESEFKFIRDLLKKIKVSARILSDEEKEDIGLLKAMKDADRNKKVSEELVMKKLAKK
jgi:hypothetical protein